MIMGLTATRPGQLYFPVYTGAGVNDTDEPDCHSRDARCGWNRESRLSENLNSGFQLPPHN